MVEVIWRFTRFDLGWLHHRGCGGSDEGRSSASQTSTTTYDLTMGCNVVANGKFADSKAITAQYAAEHLSILLVVGPLTTRFNV